jgi:hypothetical protein
MSYKRGTIKVMVSGGTTRIQETLGDTIKIWSAEEWSKEVAKRTEEDKVAPKEEKAKKVVDEEDADVGGLIQDDEEDDSDAEEVVAPTKPKGKGRKKF